MIRSVEADGVRLHVRTWPEDRDGPADRGSGAPGVLLLHGLASTSHIWDLVGPRLSGAGLRAVAYDQRGHGRSGKPSFGYGFERTSADAVAVIRAMGLGRSIVVGHSWGANVALDLAVRRPRSVGGLVLVDGGFVSLRDRFDWPTARQVLAPPDLRGILVQDFLGHMRRELGGSVRITPDVEAVALSLMRIDRRGRIHPRLSRANHLRILRALWEQDVSGLLRRLRAPTLVLAARSTPGSPEAGVPDEKRRAAAEVRSIGDPIRFEWIEGIHDVPLQRPAALAGRIVRMATRAAGAEIGPSVPVGLVRAARP